MKNKILTLAALLWLPLTAAAGDIRPGAVPGSINYQGRLERDNAPITGVIHLFFRIYNASSSGTMRWQSPELIVTAAQGIFSAGITPPVDVFSRSETLYLEVQVESDVLTPREPLNSVAFALVAKKLEDGASVSVTTFTAANQVLLATTTYSMVGIGATDPDYKLTINGSLKLRGPTDKIYFQDGSSMGSAGLGTAVGGVTSPGDSTIESGTGGVGKMVFNTALTQRMLITDNTYSGTIAIGPSAIASPQAGRGLDIDGSLYVGNAGIYDRDDTELNVKQDLVVEGGRVRGVGQNYLSIGETANTIVAATNNTQRLWIDPSGNVGVGLPGPTEPVHAAGNIRSNTGVRGGAVSLGGYTGWTSAANEVRAQNGSHLLLQQNNPFNVGIGTDTPRERLHVHGSVLADYGVIAATAGFSGDVGVSGNFTANGNNKQVFLTSTTIYGTLQVSGGIGSMAGFPAYLASTQTLTGLNTFASQVVVSSDIMTPSRLGVAMTDFNFGAGRYLQVGDNKAEYSAQNTVAYLVGGDAANARLAFYRGPVLAGSLETQNGANLAMVVGGQTKTLTDSVYHRIQNSVVWISTGPGTTPAIYVSSQMGNVGIGTTVSDPTDKLTVKGNLHIIGLGNSLTFPDGSVMDHAGLGSASSIANGVDAVVAANTLGGGGNVILRNGSLDGLAVDSSGRVGIGTLYPVSKLNVRGGDLVLGTPVNPYSGGPENLIVAGNIVFDGALIQRSLTPTQLSGLVVASDVYLSTSAAAKTGIGTMSPGAKFDVNGAAQFGSGATKSTFTAAGLLQLAAPLSAANGGTGGNLGAAAKGDIPYFTSPGVMTNLTSGAANYLLRGNGVGSDPSWIQSLDTNTGNTIVRRDGSGNFAGNTITAVAFSGPLTGNADTATKLFTARAINGTSFDGSAAITVPVNSANDTTNPATVYPLWTTGAGNNAAAISTTKLSFVPNTGVLTANGFSGSFSGSLVGNADTANKLFAARAINGTNFDGSAAITVPVNSADDAATGSAVYPLWTTAAGNTAAKITTSRLSFVPGTGVLTATGFSGPLTGNVTGNVSGTAATVTTAAQGAITSLGTLTVLTMGGNIAMGNNSITGANSITATTFSGALTGNVTGNVSGTAATVTTAAQPAITSVGTLTGLTVTAAITGSVTGTAATVTTAAQPAITSVGTLTSLLMGGELRLFSRTKVQLNGITPAKGDIYFCTDCTPAKVVVATGTSSGNFADAVGGTFQ